MVATNSSMIPLGTPAPAIDLINVIDQKKIKLVDYAADSPVVVAFICNHCPFVRHILKRLIAVAEAYQKKGIKFVAISANDVQAFPDDAPDKMQALAKTHHFTFPYCYDETQSVAKAYRAACTPDFFLFDRTHKCVYRGQFDDSRPNNDQPVNGHDLMAAMDCVLSGKSVTTDQKPSFGCNIKWKKDSH